MKLYIAASSQEIPRAKKWMAACREKGIIITSMWPETIDHVGDANPREASKNDRLLWASTDEAQIKAADYFWMLAPSVGTGRGAYGEWGIAHASGKECFSSGDTVQSIFLSKTIEFVTDEECFEYLCKLHHENGILINLDYARPSWSL